MTSPHCVFLVEEIPLSQNAKGGATALNFSHLKLLLNSPCSVDLVRLTTQPDRGPEAEKSEAWEYLRGRLSSYHSLALRFTERRLLSPTELLKALLDPSYLYANISEESLDSYRKVIELIRPTFIWAEHLNPAILAYQADLSIPVIYSHHDWKWRIKRYRAGRGAHSLSSVFRFWLMRRYEEALVKSVAGCVSASISEAAEIRQLRDHHVAYLPTTYQPMELVEPSNITPVARIVHLGGMGTTANRLGLERFLAVTWTLICKQAAIIPELWIVGSLEGASQSLLDQLEREGAKCTGYVEDLSTVLRPYDIQIIPWEYDTGTRTRIPLALNHAQVLVSTKAAANCIPELTNRVDCVLVDNLEQMASEIVTLLGDAPLRERLACAGRKTFQTHFTREAIQPRFNEFVQEITNLS